MTDDNIAAPYSQKAPTLALRALRRARESIYRAASFTGLNQVVSKSGWRDERLLILCYHGVSLIDEHQWSDLYVSPALLDRRLAWLRKNDFNILPLDEAIEAMYAKRLPPRAVTLTFDDGTCDFALRAMPLLATYRAHATVYLTTYHVRSQFPIFGPMSSYLLWKSPGRTFTLPDSRRRVIAPDEHDRIARDALQKHMADSARDLGLSAEEKHAWLEDLAKELGIDLDALVAKRLFHIMSPAELRSLDRSIVDLQLHTHRHLMPDDPAKFRREIDDNRAAMADYVGDTPLRHFCYPSGEYLPHHLQWLEDAGVVSATTCNPGLAGPKDRRLLLPRLLDTERITDAKFAAWAHGPGPIVRLIAGSSLG